jgi:hypothetical protein
MLVVIATLVVVQAAAPPQLINYQGVLRDDQGAPLDGAYDMVFRLYDAPGDESCVGGTLLLVDQHARLDAVTVTNGLFNVQIGAGDIDPGAVATLSEVFRDYEEVWLDVEVSMERLCPRVRIISAAYSLNADHLDGADSSYFLNTSATRQTKATELTLDASATPYYGVRAFGQSGGGYFTDSDDSALAYVAYEDLGIWGYGDSAGGRFQAGAGTGEAWVGYGDYGIEAFGSYMGGHFYDTNSSGYAYLGFGDYGVQGRGNIAGGYFADLGASGRAYLGYGDYGIQGNGNEAGGWFRDLGGTGEAYAGRGDRGIEAYGSDAGGYFENALNPESWARLGDGTYGVEASGFDAGAHFTESYAYEVAWAYLAYLYGGTQGYGFYGGGEWAGGWFQDYDSTTYTYIAFDDSSVGGSGTKSFVQNHPYRDDEVIVYFSLEGDEAGTYTRGSARLVNGEARVTLGETFQWVTNPDLGLTAHVTPREECAGLYVESLSTTELVVRESGGGSSDAAFDYVVHGLRIGFEETGVVREKEIESFIPSMAQTRALYERRPEFRRYNALERFRSMATEVTGAEAVDLSNAEALRAAVQEYDPDLHGSPENLWVGKPEGARGQAEPSTSVDPVAAPAETRVDRTEPAGMVLPSENQISNATPGGALMPVGEPVEIGDVVVLDRDRPGTLRRAGAASDPAVAGVVTGLPASTVADAATLASVAQTGLVECKVDAGYGAIRVGDILITSPTPGHAMLGLDPVTGTVLGKAAEPLDTGTGTILVLVMPH